MRIAIVTDWYSAAMGYSSNFLPQALARLGHDVHLVTSTGQVYCTADAFYREVWEPFLGPPFVAPGRREVDGYTLHRLPSRVRDGALRIDGLVSALRELEPDIVEAVEYISPSTLEVAMARRSARYKLFVECHVHASVFPAATGDAGWREWWRWRRYGWTKGRFISRQSEKCYPISTDSAEIAVRFFGAEPHKVRVQPLGVETAVFRPPHDDASREAAAALRRQLGFDSADVVAIYTGRLTRGKGVLVLADAVAMLRARGLPFKALFVGNGNSADVEAIKSRPGCIVHPFVMCGELPPFYWAADIGVWPKEESTSQIDAAACGLPLILNQRVTVRERIDGNGLTYEDGNAVDLAARLGDLADPTVRRRMGERGAEKMRKFAWDRIAAQRVEDFNASL